MAEIVQANWFLILAALVIGLLVAWWIFVVSRRTRVQLEDKEESEGKPARRNQALIDAPPAARQEADLPPPSAAPLGTDAEAGDGTPAAAALQTPPPPPAPAPASGGDDLSRIKGVGPKLVTLLAELGVHSFADIAAWSDADIDRVDAQLGRFQGRIRRDNWVDQAKMLQAGDMAAYEATFGRTS